MNLDRAIGILKYSIETGISEARIEFQDKAENIQFLADSTDDVGLKELYLVQITHLKSAWSLVDSKESKLEEGVSSWQHYKATLLNSEDAIKIQKKADEALLDAHIEFSKQLYTRVGELQPRNNYAFERIEFCNYLLSEFKKAERELLRLRNIEAQKSASKSSTTESEANEVEWIYNTLLKVDQPDGALSPLVKNLFLSGKGVGYGNSGKKSRKKNKKEAVIFSSVVLIFAVSVLVYAYRGNIGVYLESLNYEKTADGTVIYTTKDYIKKADGFYESGNYVKALIQYSLASAMDANNEYLQEQIAVCKLLIQQEQAQVSIPANFTNNIKEDTSQRIDYAESITDTIQQVEQENELAFTDVTASASGSIDTMNVTRSEESEFSNNNTNETLISDTMVTSAVFDSLLLTDNSSFVANIDAEESLPEVQTVQKIDPHIALSNAEVKKRIISKANDRLQEDQEFLSKIYLVADKRPEPKGGFANFDEYLKRNMEYPSKAVKNKIEGVVYVQFIVNRDGTVSNASTTTNLGYGLEEEAIRLITEYPGWEPGQINARNVNVQTSLPVWFVNQ